VNQSELTGYQHGPTIGIAGLPQDLPGSGLLVKQPWESCTQQVTVTGQGQETLTTVGAGIQTGGQPLGNDAMLVKSAGNNYVIWDGERMLVRQRTQTALFPDDSVSSVPLVWLSSIKQGAPFQAPVVDGSGTPVNGPNGLAKAGQVYEETSTGDFFVLTANGKLAPINSLQSLMLLVLSGQKQATSVGESAVGNDTTSPLQSPGLPTTKPSVLPAPSGAFCAVWSGSGPALTMQVETGGSLPSPSTATGASSTSGLATNVAIPPGKGALVQETGDSISYFLVTGGFRYAIQSQAVLGYLGYLPSEAVQVPGSVLDLIPKGPGLYPVNASNPVPAG
jgi:Type VII secretion system ESX-1, transport TM domain B